MPSTAMTGATLIFVCLAFLVQASFQIELNSHPMNVSVFPGENVTLDCIFSTSPEQCIWMIAGRPIFPDKIKWHYNREESNCSLRINDVNLDSDDGFYTCSSPISTTSEGASSNPAKVTVLVTPTAPVIEYKTAIIANNSDLVVPDGDSFLNVTCTAANGNPNATLRWFINSTELDGNQTFTVDKKLTTTVSKLDLEVNQTFSFSWLSCNCSHPASNATNMTRVLVKVPSPTKQVWVVHNLNYTRENFTKIDFSRISNTTTVSDRENVSLVCLADGEPKPEFRWEKKDNVDGVWKAKPPTGQRLTLVNEAGLYRCKASNMYNVDINWPTSFNKFEVIVTYAQVAKSDTAKTVGIIVGVIAGVAILGGILYYTYAKHKLCFAKKPKTSQGPELSDRRYARRDIVRNKEAIINLREPDANAKDGKATSGGSERAHSTEYQ